MRRALLSIVLLFSFSSILIACPTLTAYSTGCTSTGWAKSATVNVYIVGSFDATATSGIKSAFANWNSTVGSSLTLNYSTTAPGSPSGNFVIIEYGTFTYNSKTCTLGSGKSATTCEFNTCPGGATSFALIAVDSGLPDSGFLPTFVHEVGHTYGIVDCVDCNEAGSGIVTVMDPAVQSSYSSPLCCDSAFVYTMTSGSYGVNSSCSGGCDLVGKAQTDRPAEVAAVGVGTASGRRRASASWLNLVARLVFGRLRHSPSPG